ncbi:unnamed protein product [Somion occarium]|uniref:Oxidoreductase AflY n=1 Tax=Somion occarium TaxID=3059160 RepID=A0ABP1D865_9APHY
MNTSLEILEALFPKPSPAPKNFLLTPTRIPGATPDSIQALLEYLKDNHRNWHIFFNDRQFHNHAAHHLLAIYALGADRNLLKAAYQTHVLYQRPSFPSPGEITQETWKDYLGDEKYYQAYVTYFTERLLEKGAASALESYVFSKDANVVGSPNTQGMPYMLSRYLGGFLHPYIHAGYGAEFGQLGMWAEGLAQAAVHTPDPPTLILPLLDASVSPTTGQKKCTTHALTIAARIAADPAFSPSAIGLPVPFDGDEELLERVVRIGGDKLLGLLNEWQVEPNQQDLEKKVEELIWMNTAIYVMGGWAFRKQGSDEKKEFNANFLAMHLVTSVLFLPSTLTYLKPSSAVILVRAFFATSVALYIGLGAPALPIADFYRATETAIVPPGVHPTPSSKFFRGFANSEQTIQLQEGAWAEVSKILTPNPWLPIIQSTLVHPDEHLCKIQRALSHFAAELGETAPGTFSSLVSGLDDADILDGTLFIRAAILTQNRLGWMREGQDERNWDRQGFY